LAGHGGSAIDENINAAELSQHVSYGNPDDGIIAGGGEATIRSVAV